MSSLSVVKVRRTDFGIAYSIWATRCGRCGWHTETRDEPLALALARNHECAVGV